MSNLHIYEHENAAQVSHVCEFRQHLLHFFCGPASIEKQLIDILHGSCYSGGIMKTCIACGATRDFVAFYRNRHALGGYEPRCKPCFVGERLRHAGTLIRSEKRCSHCRETKPLGDFYSSKSSRDGTGNYCKPCVKARYKEYREHNPKVRLLSRLSAKIFRENQDPEARRQHRRDYYRKNRERILRQRKENRLRETMQRLLKGS